MGCESYIKAKMFEKLFGVLYICNRRNTDNVLHDVIRIQKL